MTTALEEVAADRFLDVGSLRDTLINKMLLHFEGDEFVAVVELFIAGLNDTMRTAYLNLLLEEDYINSIRNAGVH